MGTQNSKEGEKEGFQSPFSGLGAALSVALPKNMNMPLPHLRKLNPAVALQTLMKPSQYAVKKGAHHLRNIFAVPLDWTDYKPPVHPKSVSEEEFILEALKQNFVFSCVVQETLSPLMLAFEKYKASAGDTLIRQGDQGDYFYVLYAGKCNFQVDGKAVGEAGPGDSFGELALLYTCPRAATVQALTDVTVFRVDQKSFRYLLRHQTEHSENIKLDLLAKVPFLADLRPTDLQKLADAMTPRSFPVGTALLRQGEPVKSFFVLERGRIAVTNVTIGGADYADQMLEPGSYGGEQIILRNAERQCNATAETDVLFFLIDKATFETVMGSHAELVMRSADKKNLNSVKVIQDTKLDPRTLESLADLLVDHHFKAGSNILQQGQSTPAALYFVRKGEINVTTKDGSINDTIKVGGFFGEEQLLADAETGIHGPRKMCSIRAEYTVTVTEDCVCGILRLSDCRMVMDTLSIGKPRKSLLSDSIAQGGLKLTELKRHRILGAGTFGQVWMVSRERADGSRTAYALKIQSKFELCENGQARAVITERDNMATLQHPLLCNLVCTFQDDDLVYMVMGLVQGGELHSIMYPGTRAGVSENKAKFYAAGIHEGLAYMHRRGFVYRDLKPENVMIDSEGYTVIVDYGFVKFIDDKTYTLCGTPLYIAPEVILNRGHSFGVDHWSLGVLLYEMFEGHTPFYTDGMDQMDLFRAIARGRYSMPKQISSAAKSILEGLLTRDPKFRLGSLAAGEYGIYHHPWFKGLDFEKLRNKEIKAPYVPDIKDPLDSSNFDDWSHLDDKQTTKYPKLDKSHQAMFKKF